MKTINIYITEKLKLGKKISNANRYNYFPKTKEELEKIIAELIKERGVHADLNDIDTEKITDMSDLFIHSVVDNDVHLKFDGDISQWDVSNVENMSSMFAYSIYSGKYGDISNWDVSKVKDMEYMFMNSKFNGDISNWNIQNLKNIDGMFYDCPLENNFPKWAKKWLDKPKY